MPATGVRAAVFLATDRGVPFKPAGLLNVLDAAEDLGDGGGLALRAPCDDEPSARDSKAEIRDWRADGGMW